MAAVRALVDGFPSLSSVLGVARFASPISPFVVGAASEGEGVRSGQAYA